MTECPPTAADLDPPNWTMPMQGLHTEFLSESTRHDENDPKLQLMWNEGCSNDRVWFVGGEHHNKSVADTEVYIGADHKVECDIPFEEWDSTWQQVLDKGAHFDNPNSFTFEPIHWIRFELVGLIEESMHWWLEVDDPFAYNVNESQFASWDLMEDIKESTTFIAGMIAVFSLLFVAGRMVMRRDSEPARDMVRALITLVTVSAVGVIIVVYLIRASSWFTAYFIVKALPPPEADHVEVDPNSTTEGEITAENHYCLSIAESIKEVNTGLEGMDFFLFLVCATLIFIGSIVMFMYMVGRVFALTLLVGLLPLAAAGTATEFGKSWFDQNVRAIMAFILIKPAGTVVFVSAIRLSEPPGGGSGDYLVTAMLLCLGTVLLPAMVVLMFPFVAPAAGGGGMAKTLAVAPVAVGAKAVKSGVTKLGK